MNPSRTAPPSRIIVAVGPAAADAAALTLAARFAHASGAELAALFVEDLNLLRLAALPFAFEIGPAFASWRPLTVNALEHSFRQQADLLRRGLAELAQAMRLRSSFTVARGMLVPALLGAAAAEDLVVLACNPGAMLPHLSALDILHAALRGPAPAAAQPVVAVLQSAATAGRMLAAAQRFAEGLDAELVLLIAHEDDNELAALAEQWLARASVRARIRSLPRVSERKLADAIAREKPQALLWQGDGESKIMAETSVLLDALDCPLIVVR
jgi:hypothetical protein